MLWILPILIIFTILSAFDEGIKYERRKSKKINCSPLLTEDLANEIIDKNYKDFLTPERLKKIEDSGAKVKGMEAVPSWEIEFIDFYWEYGQFEGRERGTEAYIKFIRQTIKEEREQAVKEHKEKIKMLIDKLEIIKAVEEVKKLLNK